MPRTLDAAAHAVRRDAFVDSALRLIQARVGQPMIGQWDVAGVVACLVIGIGGILLGAWGVARRDVAR